MTPLDRATFAITAAVYARFAPADRITPDEVDRAVREIVVLYFVRNPRAFTECKWSLS